MPMQFKDIKSLIHAASVHGFRNPVENESEDHFRNSLADHVASIDPVEAHEIRTGRGWDEWTEEDQKTFINKPKEYAPQGDIYGISSAMKSMVKMYQCSSRRTGRTSHLINQLLPGDMVIFATKQHMEHFRHELRRIGKEHQINLRVVDASPRHRQDLHLVTHGTPITRLHFDHQWLEMFYEHSIEAASNEISHLQRSLSRGKGIEQPKPIYPQRFSVYE